MAIKNIIFDLGGVLLNLDTGRTTAAFAALMGGREKQVDAYEKLDVQNVFTDYEIGIISSEEFVAALQAINPLATTPSQIKTAWNAMLLDFPAERIELLKELKTAGYKIYLLSNTNAIHLEAFNVIVDSTLGINDFDALFEQAFYSHLIGHRKPHKATYDYIVDKAGVKSNESVFIDDTASNLVGARAAGLHTIHHKANSNINKRLKAYFSL